MKKLFFFSLVLLLLLYKQSYSQRTENAIYFSGKKSRIVLEIENDLLFNTDSYYTSGQAISYSNRKLRKTPAQFLLNLIIKRDIDITGFGLQQRIYTPYSIEYPSAIEDDRPYSAYFLVSNYSVFINAEHRVIFSNEIGIGAMGPVALGEQAQTFVHKIIGSPLPIGWDKQLNNAFLLDYHFRVEKSVFSGLVADHLIPYAEARVGTLTDRIKLGLKLRIGNKSKSMIELAKNKCDKRKVIWEWIFGANFQGVFYDATLQGGLFNENENMNLPKQDVIERQYQLRMGINFYFYRFSFRYMVNYNSKDFANAVIHKYGSANFGYSF